MVLIPLENALETKLNTKNVGAERRTYNGLSGVGEKCIRKLQYDHYWAYTRSYSARIERLFNFGHYAENIMAKDLINNGYKFKDSQAEVIGAGGHWKGHCDGVIEKDGEELLVEFKTHNDKSFKALKKNKVLKSKPMHYAQMQAYMGYMNLDKALYMAINKNDSEYYLEFVDFDANYFADLISKCLEVITADTLLPRIPNASNIWFECKFCDAKDVCFNNKPINKSCRSCKYVDVLEEGKWYCGIYKKYLDKRMQIDACNKYEKADIFNDKT